MAVPLDGFRPGDPGLWFKAFPDTLLVLDDGSELATLADAIASTVSANFAKIAEQIGLARIDADTESGFTLQVGLLEEPWLIAVEGERRRIFARYDEGERVELHPVLAVQVIGNAVIHVTEVTLQHARLGEVTYSYGEGQIGGRAILTVVTEGEHGGKVTVRPRPTPRRKSKRMPKRTKD